MAQTQGAQPKAELSHGFRILGKYTNEKKPNKAHALNLQSLRLLRRVMRDVLQYKNMRTFSSQRLHQAFWAIVSLYFAILVVEIVSQSVVPLVLGKTDDPTRWWLVPPTLFLFLLSTFEAFLWMNPHKDDHLSLNEALFLGFRLLIYVLAIVTQMFLLIACTDFTFQPYEARWIWACAMGTMLSLHLLFNITGLVWPHDAPEKRKREYWGAIPLYCIFAIGFFLLSRMSQIFAVGDYGKLLSGFTVIYFALYFRTWRKWYVQALSPTAPETSFSM